MGLFLNSNMDTTQRTLKMASETITRYFKLVDDLCMAKTTPLDEMERRQNGARMFDELRTPFVRIHGEDDDAAYFYSFREGLEILERLCDRIDNVTPKLRNYIYKLCELFNMDIIHFNYVGEHIETKIFSEYLQIPMRHLSQFFDEHVMLKHHNRNTLMINFDAALKTSNHHLFFYFDTVSFARKTLEYTNDFDFTSAWLLRTGIEPNPGPTASCARDNRYSAHEPVPTRHEKKKLKREIRLFKKAYQNQRKEKRRLHDELNNAQLGAQEVSINIPQECSKCGKCKCDCMTKREMLVKHDFYAALMGLASTVIGLIERIVALRSASLNQAQIGFGTFFGTPNIVNSMDNIATNVNEVLNNLPTSQGVGEAVKVAVTQILENQCGFLPISVKAVFQCFLTLVGLFVLYHLGCISIQVLTMPLELLFMGVESITDLLRSFRNFVFYTGLYKSKETNNAQLGIEQITQTLESWAPKAFGLLGALISSYCLIKIPDKNNTPAQWMMRIGLFPRTCASFMDVLTWVKVFLSEFLIM